MDRIEDVEEPNGNGAGSSLEPPQEYFPPMPDAPEPPATPGRYPRSVRNRPRQPSIRLRRLSSASLFEQQAVQDNRLSSVLPVPPRTHPKDDSYVPQNAADEEEEWQGNRRRSNSEPRPGRFSALPAITLSTLSSNAAHQPMSPVREEETASQFRPSMDLNTADRLATIPSPSPAAATGGLDANAGLMSDNQSRRGMLRRASNAALSAIGRNRASTVSAADPARRSLARDEYDSRIVDLLDVIDPEISTLSTLTNVQNSLFIPDLGNLLNRMPTYTLSRRPADVAGEETPDEAGAEPKVGERVGPERPPSARPRPVSSMTAVLGVSHFAILPDDATLEGWTQEDIEELNDHVRHMLHSRRSKFKRAMRGFWQYVRHPLGFFVTLYATLITLFGLAWVLFLIGWIHVGGQQLYIINIIDNVLVALFAIMGDGLAPFRAVDTYHMIFIAHYHLLTWKLRKKRTLPDLQDHNDLPTRREGDVDLERDVDIKEQADFSVLTPLQQQRLDHHSRKFSKSHTFYKPHETATHHAFPLRLLITIVVLLDFHSILQIALGTCTWSISYHVRPFALTTVILCCSLACNITGGVLISVGDKRTRKKDVVKRMFRQELTSEAIKKMEKRRREKEEQEKEALRPAPHTGT